MRFAIVACAVAAAAVTVLPPAFANTWHVPSDAPTIQAGIDSAAVGDTVVVACGTYYEHDISWTKSGIYLRSETSEPDCVTVDAQSLGRVFYCNTGMASTAHIEGFTITGGVATGSYGGGMYWDHSDPWSFVTSCNFVDNHASWGGGIAVRTCSPKLSNCIFSGNTADYGGGMFVSGGSPPTEFCTFSGNSASVDGGGIYLQSGSNPDVRNCTFWRNSAGTGQGGAVRVTSCSYPHFDVSIVSFSTQGQAFSWDGVGVLTIDHCCVFGNAGGDSLPGTHYDNLFVDPLFCDAWEEDFQLHWNSPCLPFNNGWEYLIGAWTLGCGYTPVEETSWGAIKAMYQ